MPSRLWVAGDQADVVRTARRWLGSTALHQLTAAFGGPSPAVRDLGTLTTWSATTLDTRHGAERRVAGRVTWTPDQIRELLTVAGPLGLMNTAGPCRSSYGITVLLGGATTGNRLRTRFARDLTSRGIDLGMLVAVTAERALSDHERATDPDSIQDRTEWSNLLRYVAEAFGPLRAGPASIEGDGRNGWQDREFHTAAGGRLRMLVAPSRSSHRRANTADTLTFLLQRVPMAERRHTLIITNAIYAPYQFFAAAPIVLSDGAQRVELLGTPTATTSDTNLLAQRIAQEIHAALNAATALLHP